jgi:chorismate dehydratase
VYCLKIRISLVDYLNAAPLGWAFLHGPFKDQFEVLPSSPARCAEQLASGEVDIGLIPSIEFQKIPDLSIIPGIGISASTQVRSVVMVRPKGRAVRTVALDTSSRTSVVLLSLILRNKMGLNPQFFNHPPDLPRMLETHDAALLIGDAALQVSPGEYDLMDLAEEWVAWQRRPFVFAFWACRGDSKIPDDAAEIFRQAGAWGLKSLSEIIEQSARRLHLPPASLWDYFERNIQYEMTTPCIEGLERFYDLACSAGFIPARKEIRFLQAPGDAGMLALRLPSRLPGGIPY